MDARQAEACAREVEKALRSDAAAMLAGMYGDAPDRWSPALEGVDRLRFTVNCLTRLRFVDRKGRLLLAYKGTIADAPAGSLPWFRHPERATRGNGLVFGHWSALGYLAEPGLRANRHRLRLGRCAHGDPPRPRSETGAPALPGQPARAGD